MPLSPSRAVEQAGVVYGYHVAERGPLDDIRQYWKGRQRLPAVIPASSPNEVRVMARSSRVNVLPIVINALVQSTFVEGFRAEREDEDLEVWNVWQANRMDARQTAIHRAAFAYGTAYAIVLPGTPVPVIRGASPRSLTAIYGEDPDWPMWALERVGHGLWRLYDDEAVYYLNQSADAAIGMDGRDRPFEFIEAREHNMGVCPVVRYQDEEDLDSDDEVASGLADIGDARDFTKGQIAPLMPLQDQIDLTTFGLQIAQHYGAFRQRYIIGWVAESERDLVQKMVASAGDDPEAIVAAAAAAREATRLQAGASQLWTFDESPDEMKVGEFEQTNIEGYIKSREASLRHAATLSQTPVHELIGELVNLSAEALAAAEAGRDRKVDERKTLLGESHEQTLWLVGQLTNIEVPDGAQVVWRDTSARAFAATVDALGKLTQMLGIPPQELWERVPGATRQDVERWKQAAESGDAFANLTQMLDRQATPPAA